jgi:septum formation inhibitor MinC
MDETVDRPEDFETLADVIGADQALHEGTGVAEHDLDEGTEASQVSGMSTPVTAVGGELKSGSSKKRAATVNTKQRDAGLSSKGGLVTARGTLEGVVLRLDGRVPMETLRHAVTDFVTPRSSFLVGNQIALEWIGAEPDQNNLSEFQNFLRSNFKLEVRSSQLRSDRPVGSSLSEQITREHSGDSHTEAGGFAGAKGAQKTNLIKIYGGRAEGASEEGGDLNRGAVASMRTTRMGESRGSVGRDRADLDSEMKNLTTPSPGRRSLFDGFKSAVLRGMGRDTISPEMTEFESDSFGSNEESTLDTVGFESGAWDDADARIIYSTVRSGQRVESEHSLIVIGDVNPGGELVAGGDIIVLGTLRGIAHAGAYVESGGGRVIFAMRLQPTQLRIGTVISRGGGEDRQEDRTDGKRGPEMARVEGNMIVVEPFQARSSWFRRLGR